MRKFIITCTTEKTKLKPHHYLIFKLRLKTTSNDRDFVRHIVIQGIFKYDKFFAEKLLGKINIIKCNHEMICLMLPQYTHVQNLCHKVFTFIQIGSGHTLSSHLSFLLTYRKVASSSTPRLVARLGQQHPKKVKSLNSSTSWLVASSMYSLILGQIKVF